MGGGGGGGGRGPHERGGRTYCNTLWAGRETCFIHHTFNEGESEYHVTSNQRESSLKHSLVLAN